MKTASLSPLSLFLLSLLPFLAVASVADNVIDVVPDDVPVTPSESPTTASTLALLKKMENSVNQGGDFRESFLFQKFKDFISIYMKKYATEAEASKRFSHFKENMKMVEKIQAKEKGSAKYGPNKFSDLSGES